jgi:cytoskeletal protein CcmA (bactofilin family)
MWKKDAEPDSPTTPPRPEAPAAERVAGSPPSASPDRATIGRSITIRGDVTGDEDLLIQGRIEGSVDLEQNSVTVGPEGHVKASLRGRVVTVEGVVEGNLTAMERVVLRSSARVQGDIAAPRVVLEDGATFRGGVDMGDPLGQDGSGSGTGAGSRGDASRSGDPGRDPSRSRSTAGPRPEAPADEGGVIANPKTGDANPKGKGSGAPQPQVTG